MPGGPAKLMDNLETQPMSVHPPSPDSHPREWPWAYSDDIPPSQPEREVTLPPAETVGTVPQVAEETRKTPAPR